MNPFRKNTPQDLDGWLEVATKWLVVPARKRIRSEIEAHYAEAVAAHVTEGLSESDANAAALADLGDAKSAARRLCKQHITKWEARQINHTVLFAKNCPWLLVNYALLFVCFLAAQEQNYQFRTVSLLISVLMLGLFPSVAFFVVRREGSRAASKLLLLVPPLWSIFFGVCADEVWRLGWLLFLFATQYWANLLTWRKLRNSGDAWQEVSPSSIAS